MALRTGGDAHHSVHCGELEGERLWDLIQVFQGILEGLVRRIQYVYWKDTVGDSKIYYHQSQKMCKKILGGSNRNDQSMNKFKKFWTEMININLWYHFNMEKLFEYTKFRV